MARKKQSPQNADASERFRIAYNRHQSALALRKQAKKLADAIDVEERDRYLELAEESDVSDPITDE